MRFSTHGSAAVAMAALASATAPVSERHLLDLDLPKDLSQPISANVDLGVDLSGTTLVAGVVAGVAVPPLVGVGADVEVAVVCDTCYTKGNINASISLDKVVPALSLSLKDIEAKLDLDISIGAAATIAVNLFTPPAPISLPLPGLKVDALISLDLIIGVETAIDLSAGIDLKLVEDATIETDIFAGKILDAAFSGLSVQVLPIEVRIGCTKLLADLRLRVELGVAAEVDIDDIIPILDLPEIGAGLEVAVFANLLEYVGFFCATPSCPLSKESYGLNIGAAVELDVAVENLLSIHLAPTISTALLSYPTTTICEHPSYTLSVPTLSATTASASVTGTASASASESGSNSGSVTATGSGSASESASATGSGSASGSGSATASGPGSASATGSGSATASGSESATATAPGYPIGTGSGVTSATSATAPISAPIPTGGSITSTVTNVQTFTITQCAASVPNCPAGYATTATLIHTTVYTTVCPATQTGAITAPPPKPTHSKPATPVTLTKTIVTLVPCSEASTFTPPTNIPTAPYPTGGKAVPSTTPAGSPSASYPAGTPSVSKPAGTPSVTGPTGPSQTGPAGTPSASYPASSVTVPGGKPPGTYPPGGNSNTLPVGTPSSVPGGPAYPTGGSPSGPATPTVVPPYPTGPIGGGSNSTIPVAPTSPQTLSTYVPSASPVNPGPSGYPTIPGETPIPTAGAAKVGSGIALAVAGAFFALL
ncbi:hypothetical protein GL218_01015 [Daldinia childiae]|uniref:uncharacterized protein n=1 Tax=Daldinia childiae TaxID=326645 RepID=UPI001447D55C|nr:uncharacterized protein GL218_01015 [Daldinia childiae]KAF3063982.1 hypothetical protein GL218_01015 [Daldinia childiae]